MEMKYALNMSPPKESQIIMTDDGTPSHSPGFPLAELVAFAAALRSSTFVRCHLAAPVVGSSQLGKSRIDYSISILRLQQTKPAGK